MVRSSKTEKTLFLLVLVGMLISGAYFFFSNSPTSVDRNENNLGYLKPLGPDVRLRGDSEEAWNKIGKESNVYKDDRVFTGASSAAQVNLKNGHKFTVEPNSLLKIVDENENPLIDLADGGFFGELKKGASLWVKNKGIKTELKAAEGAVIHLKNKGDDIQLVVLRGEATVQNTPEEPAQKVVANEQADITPEKVDIIPLTVQLLEPSPTANLWDRQKPIRLHWSSSKPEKFMVEVATDPSFQDNVQKMETAADFAEFQLAPNQVYFWRVSGPGQVEKSPTSSFSYYGLSPVQIEAPAKTETVPFAISWRDPSFSDSYEIHLSGSANFDKLEFSHSTEKAEMQVPALSPGLHYLRVISKQSTREDITSDTFAIEVTAPPKEQVRDLAEAETPPPAEVSVAEAPGASAMTVTPPEPPIAEEPAAPALKPLSEPKVQTTSLRLELFEEGLEATGTPDFTRVNAPQISWEPSPEAESHTVEVSGYADFRNKMEFPFPTQPWVWSKPYAGKYYVRVRADRKEERSYSTTTELRIVVAAPTVLKSVIEEKPNESVTLHAETKVHSLTRFVEFQFSNDVKFSNPESVKVQATHIDQEIKGFGKKYYRVRSLNAQSWPISRFSKVVTYKVTEPIPEPPPVLAASPEPVTEETPAPLSVAAEPTPEPIAPRTEAVKKEPLLKFWGGLGGNYLKFEQSGSDTLDSGTFASVKAPSMSAGVEFKLSDKSKVSVEYHDLPGEVKVQSDQVLDQGAYHWRSLIGEWQYQLADKGNVRYSFLLGAQSHQVPFLSVDGSDNLNLLSNELQTVSIGGKVRYLSKSNYEYEINLRYQSLIGARSLDGYEFSAKPNLLFDGSIAFYRRLSDHLKFGLHWGGQYQDITYDFTRDGVSSSGKQNLFNSNLQLRLIYEFGDD